MNTAKAFIYGSITQGCDGQRTVPEPDLPDEDVAFCEAMADGGSPRCDECMEGIQAEEPKREPSKRRNGEVWWTDYEAPDKPIEDFTTREVGVHGEMLAARYLSSRGLTVIQQNWRSKMGEVDIVARDDEGEVALVEVKTRLDLGGDPQCMPELAVDGHKQRRYRRIALVYLMCHPEVVRMRFDVIAVNILDRHNARLRHLVGAFSWES